LLLGKQDKLYVVTLRSIATSDAPPSAPVVTGEPQPRRYLVFAVVAVALFMASVDQTIVATALPTLQKDLHTQVNWSSWTITIYALGQILVMPLAGSISDQFGRKKVFLSAVVIFTAASLACGLSQNIYELVALRAVQAVGGGAFMPSATGIVADQFGRDRDRGIGLFTSIFPIGGIVGPVLGGVFVTYWSWRGIFLVNVPIGFVLFFLIVAFVPDSKRAVRQRLDVLGIALLGVGILGVMLAISYLGTGATEPSSAAFVVPLLIGLGALVGFVRHAAHAPAPFVPIRLLRGRGFGVMNLMNFFFGSAVLGFGALVPLYAEERYHLSTLSSGSLLAARAIGMILVAGLAVFALRRTGYRRPMIAGFVITAGGMLLMAVHAVGLSPYTWLAMSAAVTGIGIGISMPASNNAVLNLAPESTAAVAGLRGMFRQSGGITGVSVVTAILARSPDPASAQSVVFIVFAILLIAVIPLILLIPDHHGSW
jgi:EmrB/QacA subfamily drug resistance transporter